MSIEVENIDVKSLIPHREPFLLIDALKAYYPGERLLATKGVTRSEPWFQGHFPDFPVMPGVLVSESLAQTCAAFMALEALNTDDNHDTASMLYVLLRSDVRFPSPVRPGNAIELDITKQEDNDAFVVFKVKAIQNGKTCVRGSLTVAITPKEKLIG